MSLVMPEFMLAYTRKKVSEKTLSLPLTLKVPGDPVAGEITIPLFRLAIYGPLHSNGICLLDLPFLPHLKPIASASSESDTPQVAIPPGPTSLPGGLIV
jgi:hypothetical protein